MISNDVVIYSIINDDAVNNETHLKEYINFVERKNMQGFLLHFVLITNLIYLISIYKFPSIILKQHYYLIPYYLKILKYCKH